MRRIAQGRHADGIDSDNRGDPEAGRGYHAGRTEAASLSGHPDAALAITRLLP